MTIDIETEIANAKEAYLENADYSSASSTSKASAFVTACRKLLFLIPKRSKDMQQEFEIDPSIIQSEKQQAEIWLGSANESESGAVNYSFADDFRD